MKRLLFWKLSEGNWGQHKWKDFLCVFVDSKNIIKISIPPKAIYRFNATSIKTPMTFLTELEQIFMRPWKTPKRQINLKNRPGGIKLPDSKVYYEAILIKAVWYWHKIIDQWNQLESPELNSYKWGQLNYNKEGKSKQWANTVFSINSAVTTRQHVKEWNYIILS